MITRNEINISKIESFLNSIIDEVVSKNTFVGSLPTTLDAKWNDMVLIDCSNGITDLNAYGRGQVLIWLYAKPLTNGIKNIATLSKMEQLLNKAIEENSDTSYQINRRRTYQDFDNERKWHCNIIELNIRII